MQPSTLRIFTALVLLCLGALGPAKAQIYGGADSRGVVVLSNFSSDETPQVVVDRPAQQAPVDLPGPLAAPMVLVDPRDPAAAYRPLIDKVAREVSMSPKLLNAVIQVESGYQPRAVSRTGAKGLMQLMPKTAQRFGVHDVFDPQQNIRGGALYLKWLLEYFRGDLHLALAAYNAGEDAVVRAGYRIPQIAETVQYVPKVLWFLGRANG